MVPRAASQDPRSRREWPQTATVCDEHRALIGIAVVLSPTGPVSACSMAPQPQLDELAPGSPVPDSTMCRCRAWDLRVRTRCSFAGSAHPRCSIGHRCHPILGYTTTRNRSATSRPRPRCARRVQLRRASQQTPQNKHPGISCQSAAERRHRGLRDGAEWLRGEGRSSRCVHEPLNCWCYVRKQSCT
jgi:hypothetical protein